MVACVLNAPDGFRELLVGLPAELTLLDQTTASANFIHFFAHGRDELDKVFQTLAESVAKDGMIWISWPKKSSGVPTDLTENVVRDIGLAQGLVDAKVCAIDETWSGLKFVYRIKDR